MYFVIIFIFYFYIIIIKVLVTFRLQLIVSYMFRKNKAAITELVEQSAVNATDDLEAHDNDHATIVQKVKENVVIDLLGTTFTGWKQFFYQIDPFSNDQLIRAPKLYDDINPFFGGIYAVGVILFAIYILFSYLNQKPVETNSLVLASNLPPVYLNISLTCSAPFRCGNWSFHPSQPVGQKWKLDTPIQISSSWLDLDTSSPCYNTSSTQILNFSQSAILSSIICYSPSPNDGVFLTIPFNTGYASDAYLDVVITGDIAKYSNKLYATVQMQPTQSKTIFFSQTEYSSSEGSLSQSPYAADFFYNGHLMNSFTAALALRLQQFGYRVSSSYELTWLASLGTIGGFSGLLLAVVSVMRSIFSMASKAIAKRRSEEKDELTPLQACLMIVLGCFGCCISAGS